MTAALIAILLAAGPTASIDGLPIGGIGAQSLPATGCAAYLFTTGATPTFAAMASADPAMLRIAIDGTTRDFARVAQSGAGGFGFAGDTVYSGGNLSATLDMTVAARADLGGGAAIPEATLRIERTGQDTLVIPMAGLLACAVAK